MLVNGCPSPCLDRVLLARPGWLDLLVAARLYFERVDVCTIPSF